MQQWLAEIAYETRSGPKRVTEAFFLPTIDDVRSAITTKGGYVLNIREYSRSPLERLLARSTWWQVQLLRGIQFRTHTTSPGVALWKMIQSETNPRRQNILAPAREALARGLGVIDALKALNISSGISTGSTSGPNTNSKSVSLENCGFDLGIISLCAFLLPTKTVFCLFIILSY